ncbi:hypothetical protein ABZU25_33890 [Micromonospora sp. NPDC005215]|uniref:hypothetical protein n=1 Tax=Micromonospora sp. NPDC005215 TaxID=3157024 RepID=UPI0033A4E66D
MNEESYDITDDEYRLYAALGVAYERARLGDVNYKLVRWLLSSRITGDSAPTKVYGRPLRLYRELCDYFGIECDL